MSLDNLQAWAAFFDSTSGGSWLIALALVALTMAGAGVAGLALRLSRLPTRQRPGRRHDSAGDEQDRLEQFIADALRYEADQQMLRRAGAPDVHDVFPEEDR